MENLIQVFLLSMTPIGELRISIPVGIAVYQLNWFPVFLISIIGNMAPAIIILFFFKKFSYFFSEKFSVFKKFFCWWEEKTKKRHSEKIEKRGLIGLAILVSIPLPLTGAYTGSLLAVLMNLPIKKSLLAIFLGVLAAGTIVSAMVFLGINIQNYLGWQTFVGLCLFLFLIYWYIKIIQKNNKI